MSTRGEGSSAVPPRTTQGWALRMWATPDAQDPAGVARFDQHFAGHYEIVGGRILLTVYERDEKRSDPMKFAQRVINRIWVQLRLHVNELDLDLVTIPDMADRLNLTRQAVSNYVNGARGPGGFPSCRNPGGKTRVWDWGSVNAWLRRVGLDDPMTPLSFGDIAIVNGWLNRGYSLGQRDAALVTPPHRSIPRVPDPPAEHLARAFLGATTSFYEVEQLMTLLNTSDDGPQLAELLDALGGRLPVEDQQSWESLKACGLAGGMAPALRAELDGSAALQRHRTALTSRVHTERFEISQGYYRPGDRYDGFKRAIEVLCYGDGGHCKKLRGFAYINPGRTPGSPYLILSNDGRRHDHPLLEDRVLDFGGSTSVFQSFYCDHNTYTYTDPEHGRIEVRGTPVRMPFRLFEPHYKRFVDKPWKGLIPVRWAPGVCETVYDPNVR